MTPESADWLQPAEGLKGILCHREHRGHREFKDPSVFSVPSVAKPFCPST